MGSNKLTWEDLYNILLEDHLIFADDIDFVPEDFGYKTIESGREVYYVKEGEDEED